MDERAARDVVLAYAIETSDHDRKLFSDEERLRATQRAKDAAQAQAVGGNPAATADHFLSLRAELLLNGSGHPNSALAALRKPSHWPGVIAAALPLVALLAGGLTERISNPHRLDLLSLPLLGILGWNLLIYFLLILMAALPRLRPHWPHLAAPTWLKTGHTPLHGRQTPLASTAIASFASLWHRLAAPLNSARLKRIMHLSAALFGLGVALSLYARGLTVEYRVGWESTFIDTTQVQALLNVLFMPVVSLFGLPPFSAEEVAALRFGPTGGLADGARWVHLYASLLALIVILPRLVLAGAARWREIRLRRTFPLDLDLPYFRKLLGALSPVPLLLRVLPYSFAIDEARDHGLKLLARSILGETAQIMLRPSTDYGSEPQESMAGAEPGDDHATMTAVLFNLSATPEKENHGEFLQYLAQALPGKVMMVVDTSAYAQRLGKEDGAIERLTQRKRLWQTFADIYRVPLTFADLLSPHADER